VRASIATYKAAKTYLPPASRKAKAGAIAGLKFLQAAGAWIVQETPPAMRKLKAFSITAFHFAQKHSRAAFEWYQRRKTLVLDSPIEPGPPILASRDGSEVPVDDSTTRPS
jgi:hypothetical protein